LTGSGGDSPRRAVGLGPKIYARVLRFRRTRIT
jgi:hypothetical protein